MKAFHTGEANAGTMLRCGMPVGDAFSLVNVNPQWIYLSLRLIFRKCLSGTIVLLPPTISIVLRKLRKAKNCVVMCVEKIAGETLFRLKQIPSTPRGIGRGGGLPALRLGVHDVEGPYPSSIGVPRCSCGFSSKCSRKRYEQEAHAATQPFTVLRFLRCVRAIFGRFNGAAEI